MKPLFLRLGTFFFFWGGGGGVGGDQSKTSVGVVFFFKGFLLPSKPTDLDHQGKHTIRRMY